jgi:hypothetical protein
MLPGRGFPCRHNRASKSRKGSYRRNLNLFRSNEKRLSTAINDARRLVSKPRKCLMLLVFTRLPLPSLVTLIMVAWGIKIFDFLILAVYLQRKQLRAHTFFTRNTVRFQADPLKKSITK